jgi:hypothetical protein
MVNVHDDAIAAAIVQRLCSDVIKRTADENGDISAVNANGVHKVCIGSLVCLFVTLHIAGEWCCRCAGTCG